MAEIIGYARVSSTGQSLAVQLDELTRAGCTKVFAEKKSGRYTDNRPELKACIEYVRQGDVFVVSRLDRMARSILDLARIADTWGGQFLEIVLLHPAFDHGRTGQHLDARGAEVFVSAQRSPWPSAR